MRNLGLAYKRASFLGSITLALIAISGSNANSETIKISSAFVQQNSTPDFDGSLVMTFDVNGLPAGEPPAIGQNGPSVPVTNLDITITFANGSTDIGTAGSGSIASSYGGSTPTIFDYLSFSSGDVSGYFAMVDKYNGKGGVLTNDGENSSLIDAGPVTGYLNSPSSSVVSSAMPEPSSYGLTALAALALTGWTRRKRRTS